MRINAARRCAAAPGSRAQNPKAIVAARLGAVPIRIRAHALETYYSSGRWLLRRASRSSPLALVTRQVRCACNRELEAEALKKIIQLAKRYSSGKGYQRKWRIAGRAGRNSQVRRSSPIPKPPKIFASHFQSILTKFPSMEVSSHINASGAPSGVTKCKIPEVQQACELVPKNPTFYSSVFFLTLPKQQSYKR